MDTEEAMTDGFVFALQLIDSIGVDYDRAGVVRRLEEVARGEVTLLNSTDEELTVLEHQAGRQATHDEASAFRQLFTNRADMDVHHRLVASRVLRALARGQGTA